MTEAFTISHNGASAEISTQGAELLAWRVGERPLLWQPDPEIWKQTSPLLFPVVGHQQNSQIRVDGKTYPMGVHGFASTSLFVVHELSANKIALRLDHSNQTMARYPFPFQLTVEYTIENQRLSVDMQVENTGDSPMPYAIGLHPGFCWPLENPKKEPEKDSRDSYLEFQVEEVYDVPDISNNGLFLETTHKVPFKGKRLVINEPLLKNDALCFLNAKSQSLRYVSDGGSAIEITARNFPHFAIWGKPPGKFLSIETWTGHGDPEGYDGELSQKPSMRFLAPGCKTDHGVEFLFTEKT